MTAFGQAFVTGASSGIGRAVALRLAARGTRVVVASRREPDLAALCREIAAAGGRADACPLDVGDPAAVAAAVRHWDAATGGLDLVFANAGVGGNQPAADIGWETVARVLRTNVDGALATLVAAIRPMVARRRGTLAATTSLAGMRGLPTSAAYSASKAAVSVFLESLRSDLYPAGVRVVDVRPGFVDTPMTRRNRFPMPFLVDARTAAVRIVGGLERGEPVIAFPWPLAAAMRLGATIPDALWRGIAARLPTGPRRRP